MCPILAADFVDVPQIAPALSPLRLIPLQTSHRDEKRREGQMGRKILDTDNAVQSDAVSTWTKPTSHESECLYYRNCILRSYLNEEVAAPV
jgi:hypothetical protein